MLFGSMNFKPKEFGIVAHEDISVPFTNTVSWPFPQLLKGSSVTLLCDKDKIYTVDETSWTATEIVTYNPYEPSLDLKGITEGGAWHLIDLGASFLLFNGQCVVMKLAGLRYMSTDPGNVVVVDDIMMKTGCYYKGRVLLGGFDDEGFWNTLWGDYWASHLTGKIPADITPNKSIRRNMLWYSSIGGGDLSFIFYPDYASDGYIDPSSGEVHSSGKALFMDYWRRGQSGFIPMPYQGRIIVTKVLGDYTIVYGADGIAAVRHFSSPTPTLGLVEIPKAGRIGIHDRGSVGGDETKHVFVDREGVLWSLDANLQLQRLGYKEYISKLTEDAIVISHEPGENEFYICSENYGFILTDNGLGEINQKPTSIIHSGGSPRCLAVYGGENSSTLTLDWIDIGVRGVKRLESMSIGATSLRNILISVDSSFTSKDEYTTTEWKALNDVGNVTITKAGTDFRIHIKAVPRLATSIDYIDIRWKMQDKRMIRGVYDVSSFATRADRE